MRYDYNEPYCRKDQCDSESAVAKNLIRSFVDARHNWFSASVIFYGLQLANGMKDTKVGVAKTDKYLSVINGKTIRDISLYHSLAFHENGMRFWRYFNVGAGVIILYSNSSFSSYLKGCVRYIFASLLFKSKREHLSN